MTPTTEYREIPLTKGQVTIVDADDYEWLSRYSWYAHWGKTTESFYAYRRAAKAENADRKLIGMHRMILGMEVGDKRHPDHINNNTLDNRRCNLRILTHSQNLRSNRKMNPLNTSGYRGVTFHKASGLWMAQIQVGGKHVCLGYFHDPLEASKAYQKRKSELLLGG